MFRPEEWNDPTNYYHPRPVADLVEANPDFDWPRLPHHHGHSRRRRRSSSRRKRISSQVDGIVASTDLETIKDYLKLQVLWNTASALTRGDGRHGLFDFYGTVLNGVEQQRPDEEQALGAVNGALGVRARQALRRGVLPAGGEGADRGARRTHRAAAARARIEALDWMSPETKADGAGQARRDARQGRLPRQVADLRERQDRRVVCPHRSSERQHRREQARAGARRPTGRSRRVGHAAADGERLLRSRRTTRSSSRPRSCSRRTSTTKPTWRTTTGPSAPSIGHEITHAFDQSGSQFDAKGNLPTGGRRRTRSEFEALTDKVVEAVQRDGSRCRGSFVDGELTIGENIADMGGLQIAYDALQAGAGRIGRPGLIEGLTQDQRFFLANRLRLGRESPATRR